MNKIVIMPGGFHPFHAGHYALYKSAVDAFPGASVYVAATNDQKARPFPFEIKEKLAKVAGVAPGHFVQVKSPFKAEEITSHFNPAEDVLIFVRSEKDRNEQPKPGGTKKDGTPSYFQPYTGKNMQPFSKHAYFAYLPTVEFGPGITSATQIRAAWPTLDGRRKTAMVMSLYPASQKNPKLAANIVKMMDIGMGSVELEESKEEALQYATQAHAGQTRSGGAPYITHPMSVANSISQYKKSHNLDAIISAALLHDTVEDTDTTHEALHDLFGGLVASLVQELTSDKDKIKQMGKADYLAHKMAAMSSYALVIKLADRLDNVQDIATAKTPEWREKYRAETEKILNYIEKHRVLSGTHRKFIELIRTKLGEINSQPVAEGWKEGLGYTVLAGLLSLGAINRLSDLVNSAVTGEPTQSFLNRTSGINKLNNIKTTTGQGIESVKSVSSGVDKKFEMTLSDGRKVRFTTTDLERAKKIAAARQASEPVEVKEQGVAEGLSDVVKGIKRKVAGNDQVALLQSKIKHSEELSRSKDIPSYYRDHHQKTAEKLKKELATLEQQGVAEGEGDSEGLPHLTRKLASHISKQIDTEGPHAVTKSIEYGDGAADELLGKIKEMLDDYTSTVGESAAWQKKEGKNKTGGLNSKGVASYRREHPGSQLQTAVTTKPSKLKPGSKAANRRKSFCARMGGMKGPMKDEHGKPTRKALALRKWNCESVEQFEQMLESHFEQIDMLTESLRTENPCWKGYHPVGTKKKNGKSVPNCVLNTNEASLSEDDLDQDPQLSKPIKPFSQIKQYPLSDLL